MDPNFKKEISWGNLQLDKFQHVFLNGEEIIPSDKNIDAANLEENLRMFNPQIIIIYGYYQKLQRRARRWAISNKVKICYISDSELRHKRNRIKEFLKNIFVRWYFSKVDYFLTVGNANEAYYQKYGVDSSQFIRMHYSIDINLYEKSFSNKAALATDIREKYGIQDGQIVLSVVGKLVPWKNQDHIIDAMEILENAGLFVHLLIIGSGVMQDTWKLKAGKLRTSKVHFTGFVNPDELPGYYAATDVYVHPASIEPHSIAISEAIFMGCPVILSDLCGSYGPDDDVQQGKNGLVFEFGNIEQLAGEIKKLIEDEKMRKEFSAYSHSIAEKFQKISHVKTLDNIISQVHE